MQSLVLQLQADAIDATVSTATLLRKAKIVATKLDLPEFLEWIDHELDGYLGVLLRDLPPYRQLTGSPQCRNPYQGWQPIFFPNAESHKMCSSASIGHAIGPIEQMLSTGSGSWGFSYSPEMQVHLTKALDFPMDVRIQISSGQLLAIVEAVRNTILKWSLELEKSGILGEGLIFSENEKREATQVSHQFFVENIGVVGNISDQAHVRNMQFVQVQQPLDYDKLAELVRQIGAAMALMPEDKRDALAEQVTVLDQELAKEERDLSRIGRVLASIRSICEGAAGNVVAQGILSLLARIGCG